jgi:hypothetical protein
MKTGSGVRIPRELPGPWIPEKEHGDFAIVNQNPLKIDPLKIRDITVFTTIKGGKVYYQK